MNITASIQTFLGAIVFGMGFRCGYGLIELLVDLAAKAVR